MSLRFNDSVDFSRYEDGIRQLLNTYVNADDARILIEPLDISNKEKMQEQLARLGSNEAKAEAIQTRQVEVLESQRYSDPIRYMTFMERINKTLEEYLAERDSEKYLSSMEKMAEDYRAGRSSVKYPENIMDDSDPNVIFPNEFGTTCFLKNVVKAPNIIVGDYTYYDEEKDPAGFEKNNVLFNYPEFGDRLIIGKFCCIASGVKFIMGPANHRLSSVTTYPFHVFGGVWEERTPPHMSQLPFKGDIVIGNDVWLGRESVVMPGVHIGDGAIVAAYSVVTKDIPPYSVAGGNPARVLKKRFDDGMTELMLKFKWWDLPAERLAEILPLLCDPELEKVRKALKAQMAE